MELRCELGLPPADLSPNAHVHWRRKQVATRKYRFLSFVAFTLALRDCKWVRPYTPTVMDIVYRCYGRVDGYKAKDAANAQAALKAAVDGMVDAGIVVNDSNKWLKLGSFALISNRRDLPAGSKSLPAGVLFILKSEAK